MSPSKKPFRSKTEAVFRRCHIKATDRWDPKGVTQSVTRNFEEKQDDAEPSENKEFTLTKKSDYENSQPDKLGVKGLGPLTSAL